MIKWVLVYVALTNGTVVEATTIGAFPTVMECFAARDHMAEDDGYFAENTQAVCVPTRQDP